MSNFKVINRLMKNTTTHERVGKLIRRAIRKYPFLAGYSYIGALRSRVALAMNNFRKS